MQCTPAAMPPIAEHHAPKRGKAGEPETKAPGAGDDMLQGDGSGGEGEGRRFVPPKYYKNLEG